jgi:hypothetical protein
MKTQTTPKSERKRYKYTRPATPTEIAECAMEGTPAPAGKQSPNGLAVHPAADIFPLMNDDELQELAADIAENGLIHPIMLDQESKLLVDGRNRLAACKIAGVEPAFESLAAGEDPLAYIASANLMRRNLSKGQQAMALAMMYPEPGKGGRGNKNGSVSEQFSKTRLSNARAVLRYSRGLAEQVLKGDAGLDEALAQVHSEEGKARSRAAQIDELRAKTTDLADKVKEGRMKFDEAMAEYHQRLLEEQRIREGVKFAFDGLTKFPGHVAGLCQAIDAGADSPLDGKMMKLIHDSVALLDEAWQGGRNGKGK